MIENITRDQHEILGRIAQSAELNARFLNTLSYMELLGAQKISRALSHLPKESRVLEHVAEEYRHSYYLRKLANKLADRVIESFDDEVVLARAKARKYIIELDRRICLLLSQNEASTRDNNYMAYLLTTYMIEKRALPFYLLYQDVLDRAKVSISLRSIISEEESHLRDIEDGLAATNMASDVIRSCREIEESLFNRWINAIANDVQVIEKNNVRQRP